MAAQPIDYAALAQQARQANAAPTSSGPVDYAALAAQARGAATPASGSEQQADSRNSIQKSFDENTATSPSDKLLTTGLKSVVGAIGSPFVHPLETVKALSHIGTPYDPENPLIQTALSTVNDYKQGGLPYAATKLAGNTFGGMALGEAAGGVLRLPSTALDIVRGDPDVMTPGTTATPRMRYEAAKRLGVNLDAADATGSPILGGLKRINENSLFGSHLYDNLKGRNTGALEGSTNDFMNALYEGDRESGGRSILDALQNDQRNLKSGAESGFQQLSDQTEGVPVKGAPAVGQSASSLLKTIEPLADKYPSLAPAKTIHILRDLSRVGAEEVPRPTGFLDAPGSEFAVPQPIRQAPMDTWNDLQRLRSATHDLTISSPDLVKSQAIAPLQRMTSSLDDAMTNASSGLTPKQEALFRQANSDWKDMKGTYDDPSSPFYHAVRTDNPSTLFGKVGPQTPENALNLRKRLSPFESYPEAPSPALGAMRRGTVESALKPGNEGAPNFRTFGANLNRIPADYRAELFSPDQNSTLRDINLTSNALAKDFNPSGSAKQGQKIAEAAALIPTGGLPLAQYPLAKIMTSPAMVERLMRPANKPNLFFAPPVAGGTAGAGLRRIGQQHPDNQ
jgi:hypothetical protein